MLAHSNDVNIFCSKAYLYREFCQMCEKFNEDVDVCYEYVSKDMIWEANEHCDAAKPSLTIQAELLNIAGDAKFLAFCRNYGIPLPVTLKLEAFRAVERAITSSNNSKPLIDAYRKIGRTGKSSEKIILLRKIVKIVPTQEWMDALKDVEEQFQNELASEAKRAILEKDFNALEAVEKHLISPEWQIKPNAIIVEKVCKIAQTHRDEITALQAAEKLNAVNNAYSEQNLDELQNALKLWDEFLLGNPQYVVPPQSKLQVDEAEKYVIDQHKKQENIRQCEELIDNLAIGISNGVPPEELQKTVKILENRNYPIPENIMNGFLEYKNAVESAARRAKILKTVIISVSCLAVLLLTAGIVLTVMMNKKEAQWVTVLNQSLEKDTADVSLSLLAQLEKEAGYVRKRPAILKIEKRINEKKTQQDAQREKFKTLANSVETMLKNCGQNTDKFSGIFAQMQENIVDDKEQNVFNKLKNEYNNVFKEFRLAQNKKYSDLVSDIDAHCRTFWKNVAQADFTAAEKSVAAIEKLAAQANALKEVDNELIARHKPMLNKTAEMKNTLTNFKQLLQTDDFYLFKDIFSRIVPAINDKTMQNTAQKFMGSEIAAGESMLTNDFAKVAVFRKDSENLSDAISESKRFYNEVLKEVKRMAQFFRKSQRYMVVLRDVNGRLCTMIVQKAPAKQAGTSNPAVYKMVKCMTSDSGKFTIYRLYDYGPQRVVVLNKDWGVEFEGRVVYPETLRFDKPMHLANYWAELERKLNEPLADEKTESIIIETINKLIADEIWHPVPKMTLLKQLSALLCKSDRATYKNYAQEVQKLHKKISAKKDWLVALDTATPDERNNSINNLKNFKLSAENEIQFMLLQTALSRQLKPGGFLYCSGGKYRFVRFNGIPASGELWTLNEKGNMVISGNYSEKYSTVEIKPDQAFVKLVFVPCDNRSTAALEAEMIQKAGGNVQFPMSWPIRKK